MLKFLNLLICVRFFCLLASYTSCSQSIQRGDNETVGDIEKLKYEPQKDDSVSDTTIGVEEIENLNTEITKIDNANIDSSETSENEDDLNNHDYQDLVNVEDAPGNFFGSNK